MLQIYNSLTGNKEVFKPLVEGNISIDKGMLTIRAEQHETEEDKKKGKKYVVRESSSSFYRRIALPEHADEDKIDAKMEEGILKVSVPFKELPKPKKIALKSKN